MNNSTSITELCGLSCVKLEAGGYEAYIANEVGSNVIRLRDNKNGMEFFRFNENNTADVIKQSAEVWGLPTLYLPNRFADGVLKTSDAVYQLPVNEKAPYNNHIHGFIHKRVHEIVEHNADSNCAWLKTRYVYDENDEFFKYLPVPFVAEYTFTLSENGLEQNIVFTNTSGGKVLPISIASHTTINAPFADGGKEEDIRLTVPIGKKCELNERCLPTEKFKALTMWDLEYKNGSKKPVLQVCDNDMYFGEYADLDGEKFHGVIAEDIASGKKLCYEVSEEYGFWIIWNDRGFNHYFCPEPMTAMIDAPNLSLAPDVTGYREIKPGESFKSHQRFFTKL
ncbi:MAG: aldose 1-epimerase [Ruminococcus sp.]|nr:aldose 1-epimerase [Ruminococcus sp.]